MTTKKRTERTDGFARSLPPADWPIGEKIRALRLLHGWNQAQLAERAEGFLPAPITCNRRNIGGIEGGTDPDYRWPNGTYTHTAHIVAIAAALGVSPSYLDETLTDSDDLVRMRTLLNWIDAPQGETVQVVREKPCSPVLAGQGAGARGA